MYVYVYGVAVSPFERTVPRSCCFDAYVYMYIKIVDRADTVDGLRWRTCQSAIAARAGCGRRAGPRRCAPCRARDDRPQRESPLIALASCASCGLLRFIESIMLIIMLPSIPLSLPWPLPVLYIDHTDGSLCLCVCVVCCGAPRRSHVTALVPHFVDARPGRHALGALAALRRPRHPLRPAARLSDRRCGVNVPRPTAAPRALRVRVRVRRRRRL